MLISIIRQTASLPTLPLLLNPYRHQREWAPLHYSLEGYRLYPHLTSGHFIYKACVVVHEVGLAPQPHFLEIHHRLQCVSR